MKKVLNFFKLIGFEIQSELINLLDPIAFFTFSSTFSFMNLSIADRVEKRK